MIGLQLVLALLLGQQFKTDADGAIISNASWQLPATIEVLRDVPVEVEPRYHQPRRRGVLYEYTLNEAAFRIRKGERFEMLRFVSRESELPYSIQREDLRSGNVLLARRRKGPTDRVL